MGVHDVQHHVGDRAIVIGASIGGLLAARALADHYTEVLVLERDTFGSYGEFRKGVLQARHAHGLLAGGLRAMEELLPGLEAELVARGAVPGDLQERVIWINEGMSLSSESCGLTGLLTSRLLIEDQIRSRVTALPNVDVHERADVLGLSLATSGRVAGLRVAWRDRDDAEEHLSADLIVDASGRGSRAPAWLEALGFPTPRIDEIVVSLSYTTREYVRDEPDDVARSVIMAATAEHPRGGVILVQPDGRWVVTLGGYLGEAAPRDDAGFREFATRMASPHLADALRGLRPVGEARTFKYHASTWRRYDRMRRFPDGLLVFGDSICSFNPIFGQGMTVAACEALALGRCLRDGGDHRLGRRFFTAARREIAVPWEMAASSDLRLQAVTGKRTIKTRMVNRYLPHYFRAAQHDPMLSTAFLEVVNLLARPESLMAPARLRRVWRARSHVRSAATVQRGTAAADSSAEATGVSRSPAA